jgi:hypothetical protein
LQEAIARTARLDLHPAQTAAELGARVEELLLKLAGAFGIKGIVPGHIKALVSENDCYASFSCTRIGRVDKKTSGYWVESVLQCPQLNMNVVLVNDLPVEQVEDQVDDILAEVFPGVSFEGHHHCDHDHDHQDR